MFSFSVSHDSLYSRQHVYLAGRVCGCDVVIRECWYSTPVYVTQRTEAQCGAGVRLRCAHVRVCTTLMPTRSQTLVLRKPLFSSVLLVHGARAWCRLPTPFACTA